MALNMKQITGLGILGAIAAIATNFILGFISSLVSIIPGVSLDLQSIAVTTTGLGQVIQPGVGSSLANKLLGIVPIPITGTEIAVLAAGGAAFVIIGAIIVDSIKQLQFAKTKVGKLATIYVVAGIA